MVKGRWYNTMVVRELGFVGYGLYDLLVFVKTSYDSLTLGYKDARPYREFLEKRRELTASDPASSSLSLNNSPVKKNVIYLQLESIDGLLVSLEYKAPPVMPFLNSLKEQRL